ncbi:hypothetical protein QVD17_36837 [Tagetes erecta]|uniref:Protein kinase domain-containing protein n=1 Tax=Tagetes erecta TaxID=13708 RepID=A0AAD8JTF7_TARER|nr:hypothetical protein QVD17_36837 [Tagetes erecta]
MFECFLQSTSQGGADATHPLRVGTPLVTNGFSKANLIGNGGFSSIYKGIIDENDDRFVAVKVLHLQNRGAQRSFMKECDAWRSIRHRNLLRVIISCSRIDFQAVVHGDLKPRNVILNDDLVAHVRDFGLARFLGTTSNQSSSIGIRGTIGYNAPVCFGGEMTSSGNVYSFGILLLETMTKKKPTDNIFIKGIHLHKFASMAMPNHVIDDIDVNILNIYQEDESVM